MRKNVWKCVPHLMCWGRARGIKLLIIQQQDMYTLTTKFSNQHLRKNMMECQVVCVEWQNPPTKPLNTTNLSHDCLYTVPAKYSISEKLSQTHWTLKNSMFTNMQHTNLTSQQPRHKYLDSSQGCTLPPITE